MSGNPEFPTSRAINFVKVADTFGADRSFYATRESRGSIILAKIAELRFGGNSGNIAIAIGIFSTPGAPELPTSCAISGKVRPYRDWDISTSGNPEFPTSRVINL